MTFPELAYGAAIALEVSASANLHTKACLLCGWSIREDGGVNPAQFSLWDGGGTNGLRLASVNILAGEQATPMASSAPVLVRTSLYFELRTGAVLGAVYVVPL